MKKRFQYYTRNGIEWSSWFDWDSDYCPKYQLDKHPRILNEYS